MVEKLNACGSLEKISSFRRWYLLVSQLGDSTVSLDEKAFLLEVCVRLPRTQLWRCDIGEPSLRWSGSGAILILPTPIVIIWYIILIIIIGILKLLIANYCTSPCSLRMAGSLGWTCAAPITLTCDSSTTLWCLRGCYSGSRNASLILCLCAHIHVLKLINGRTDFA